VKNHLFCLVDISVEKAKNQADGLKESLTVELNIKTPNKT
jgi:hypothetical protein